MIEKLVQLSEYRRMAFDGDAPPAKEIKQKIIDGELAGRIIGSMYFVYARELPKKEPPTHLADLSVLQAQVSALNSKLEDSPYPEVPLPRFIADRRNVNIPAAGGVYFIWEDGVIVYVGQSINLAQRVNARNHHAIREGDFVSFVEIEKPELRWAEAYYIGILRPTRNFGNHANHYKYGTNG